MDQRSFARAAVRGAVRAAALSMTLFAPAVAGAEDIFVPAGGDLQAALDRARAGDRVLLEPGATYVGNFTLRAHGGVDYVTIRTRGNDTRLPGENVRIAPNHATYLAKLQSPNVQSVLKTDPRAAYWRVMLLEFLANQNGSSDVVKLGDASTAQNSLSLVPHHLVFDRV